MDTLTKTEKRIGTYIEENLGKMKANKPSSYAFAKKLQVGQTTVIRFSQKLGYKSFRELQLDLSSTAENLEIKEISVAESISKTNFKIMKQYQDVVDSTFVLNTENAIQDTVNYIKRANRILLFGIDNSNLFAEYFSNQLRNIGLFTFHSSSPHTAYTMIAKMDKNDLVILLSESGETKEILKAAKLTQKCSVPLISITRMAKTQLHEYSNVVLKTVNRTSDSRLEAMSIRCSQLYLIDTIYLNLFKTDYQNYKEMIEKSATFIRSE
jgi:DNA-binding MurR/RpiR family transcriptional regulator